MNYLSIEEVVYIHDSILEESVGSIGIRDFNLLHSAVERPKASFGGEDLYKNLHEKVASILQSLVLNHAFVDANKRTAFVSSAAFLRKNNYIYICNDAEIYDFLQNIATKKIDFKDIVKFLEKNTKQF